jgi:hypothetical protein
MITSAQVGRASEIAWVSSFLDKTLTRGGMLVISGEAGIGKSSLLAVAKDYAIKRGFVLSVSNAVEAEMRLPYSGLHQLLTPFLSEMDNLPSAQKDSLSAAFGLRSGLTPEPFHIALAALHLVTTASLKNPILFTRGLIFHLAMHCSSLGAELTPIRSESSRPSERTTTHRRSSRDVNAFTCHALTRVRPWNYSSPIRLILIHPTVRESSK